MLAILCGVGLLPLTSIAISNYILPYFFNLKPHKSSFVTAFGYHGSKSSITLYSAGYMGLLDLTPILLWSTLHGLGLILRSFGRSQIVLSESILLVILLDFRFVIFYLFPLKVTYFLGS